MRATERIWRVPLEEIEATVAEHLGRGRVPGNEAGPCFSRQISMYLAKNVGGWSTTRIGRFYNGRHHTTVVHAIRKIERLRKGDESLDALLEVLSSELGAGTSNCRTFCRSRHESSLVDAIAARVIQRLAQIGVEPLEGDDRSRRLTAESVMLSAF